MAATQQDSILDQRPTKGPSFVSNLLAGPHGPGSSLFKALAIDCDDFERVFEDFTANTIAGSSLGATFNWQTVKTAGATSFSKRTPTALLPSNAKSAIDAAAGSGNQINGQAMATGTLNAEFWVKGEIDAVTDLQVEIGFLETIAATAARNVTGVAAGTVTSPVTGAQSGVATMAATGAAALYVFDTTSVQTSSFVTQGHGATPSPIGTRVSGVDAAANNLPVAGAEFIIGVVLRGRDAYLFGNFNVGTTSPPTGRIGLLAYVPNALTAVPLDLMTPTFRYGSLAGSVRNGDVDFLDFYQQRTAAPY